MNDREHAPTSRPGSHQGVAPYSDVSLVHALAIHLPSERTCADACPAVDERSVHSDSNCNGRVPIAGELRNHLETFVGDTPEPSKPVHSISNQLPQRRAPSRRIIIRVVATDASDADRFSRLTALLSDAISRRLAQV